MIWTFLLPVTACSRPYVVSSVVVRHAVRSVTLFVVAHALPTRTHLVDFACGCHGIIHLYDLHVYTHTQHTTCYYADLATISLHIPPTHPTPLHAHCFDLRSFSLTPPHYTHRTPTVTRTVFVTSALIHRGGDTFPAHVCSTRLPTFHTAHVTCVPPTPHVTTYRYDLPLVRLGTLLRTPPHHRAPRLRYDYDLFTDPAFTHVVPPRTPFLHSPPRSTHPPSAFAPTTTGTAYVTFAFAR